jgi:hypothetical protein
MADDTKRTPPEETWLPEFWQSRLSEATPPKEKRPIKASRLHYAGLENVYRAGRFGVEENAALLRRYEYIQRSLVYIQGAQLPHRSRWELMIALGKHLYEDAETVDAVRKRILTLRQNVRSLSRQPDQRLTLLMDELLHARTDAELLLGTYEVVKPALLATYRSHMEETQVIADQPTIRVLRQAVWDLEEQMEWGRRAITELVDNAGKRPAASEFKEKIEYLLKEAGGITGEDEGAAKVAARRWRSHQPFSLPERAVRDERFPGTVHYRTGAPDYAEDLTQEKLYWLMRVRQEEMENLDLLGALIWLQRDQPWEFTVDVARHLWDEDRHTMLGQAALEAEGVDWMSYPQDTLIYDYNIRNLPAAAYVWLTMGIEAKGMRKTGKRAEYEFAQDVAKHPLFAQFNDYDWADEVLHVHFGSERGPELYDDDQQQAYQAAQHALEEWWSLGQKAEEERPAPVPTFNEEDVVETDD